MEKNDVTKIPKVFVSTESNECKQKTTACSSKEIKDIQTPSKCHLKPPKPAKKSRKRQASDSSISETFSKLRRISPFHRRSKRIHSMGSACMKKAAVFDGNNESPYKHKSNPLSPRHKNKIAPVGSDDEVMSLKEGRKPSTPRDDMKKRIEIFEVPEEEKKCDVIDDSQSNEDKSDNDLTLICIAPDNVDSENEQISHKVRKTPSSYPDVRERMNICTRKGRSQSLSGLGLKTSTGGSNLHGMNSKVNQLNTPSKKASRPSISSEQIHVPRRSSQPFKENRIDKLENNQVNYYQMLEEIGRGSFGTVCKCMSLRDHKCYAMKIISKSRHIKKYRMLARRPGKLSKGDPLETLYREIAILKKMDHQYIIKLIEVIDDPQVDNVYMVFEYIPNGEVMQVGTDKPLSEEQARRYFQQLVLGMEYVHYSKIVHRDIKPSNLLIDDNDQIKIADFGVSTMFENGSDMTNKYAGSPAFVAPEVLDYASQDKYSGILVDIWAMGVTLFCFIYGKCPFEHDKVMELCEIIKEQPVEFPESPEVNPQCIDLISRMLAKNPSERITMKEIKMHPWVTSGDQFILPTTEEHCKMIQVSNEEISNSIKIIKKIVPFIYIKKIFQEKSFGINKRSRNQSVPNTSERNLSIS